mgnify:CR=1 FL=1
MQYAEAFRRIIFDRRPPRDDEDDKDDAEQIEANPDQASKSVGKGAEEAS